MLTTQHIKFLISLLTLWFAPVLIFLYFFIFSHHYPTSAFYSHLYLASLTFIAVALCVATFSYFIKKQLLPYIASLFCSAWLFICSTYYSLVITGLVSWGKVISIELITSYIKQAEKFSERLIGVNINFIIFGILIFFSILFFSCLILFKKYESYLSSVRIQRKITATLFASLLIFTLSKLNAYFQHINYFANQKEPVALTLQLGKSLASNKSGNFRHDIVSDPKLDIREQTIAREYKSNTQAIKKNIILIVVDALRPDHMGVYGYDRRTTPYLSDLKSKNQLMISHGTRSSCNESSCGLMSLASARFLHKMPKTPLTLQQLLKRYGYRTSFILGGDHTNFYNLKSLYGDVDYFFDGSMAKKYYINDDKLVLDKLSDLSNWDKTPTFLQIHLMSSHTLGYRWPKMRKFLPQANYWDKPQVAQQKHINFYDNGVLQTDFVIKQIIQLLTTKHYLNDALIIITADHGESLGEHGYWSHASSVYEEQLRVPLIWINYGQELTQSVNHDDITSQVDIAPNILCSLGMNIPDNWDNNQCNQQYRRKIQFFLSKPHIGLIDSSDPNHQWKYWKNHLSGQEHLYDLKTDPNESVNMIDSTPESIITKWKSLLSDIKFQ